MDNTTKGGLQSQTIIASIVSFIMLAGIIFGVDLDEGMVTETVSAIVAAISNLWAIWGRFRASERISGWFGP